MAPPLNRAAKARSGRVIARNIRIKIKNSTLCAAITHGDFEARMNFI